jgi:RNA polymerase sigma factor (sigma-70 family)
MTPLLFQNDSEILAALQGTEAERGRALQHFFENPRLLEWVLHYIRTHGGTEQDGKDVFEEAFLIFERQLRTGHFRGESSLETWFHGIARWQWAALQRKVRPAMETDQVSLPSSQPDPEKLLIKEERRVILEWLFVQIGERCKRLLGYFQLDYSMREIQRLMGYASEQVAANEVHSCRAKLKKLIQQHPEQLEALKNRTD